MMKRIWMTLAIALIVGACAGSDISSEPRQSVDASAPVEFGDTISREPGILGVGWDITISEVREIPLFDVEIPGTQSGCVAIIGTAGVRSMSDEAKAESPTANIFSFPEIGVLTDQSRSANMIEGHLCDWNELLAEFGTVFDLGLSEGGEGSFVTVGSLSDGEVVVSLTVEELVIDLP